MSDIPPHIYEKVQELALALTNASEADDRPLHDSLYQKLRAFYEEQAKLGRLHPFLTEALADYSDDKEEAVRLYRLALEQARAFPGEPTHTKMISLARGLFELGHKEQAEAYLRDGRAEAERKADPFWVKDADALLEQLVSPVMTVLTPEQIATSSDDELYSLLARELEAKISAERSSPEFLTQIRQLPIGLRAMAATYEFDVSLALDDVGWYFGNWHSRELADETARGLQELGAIELARIFRDGFRIAQQYWAELGSENWMDWYHGSDLEREVDPLSKEAWAILKGKKSGIFDYWVDYARRYPERVGASDS